MNVLKMARNLSVQCLYYDYKFSVVYLDFNRTVMAEKCGLESTLSRCQYMQWLTSKKLLSLINGAS